MVSQDGMTSNLTAPFSGLVPLAAFGQQEPADSGAEAGKHAGEEATVTGRVVCFPKPKTGRVIERARWFVPAPVVNLTLRCAGG